MKLRPYQAKAVSLLHAYFERNSGNPVLEAPTGSGKSLIQASFIRDAVTAWPQTRVLALCHVKELVEQNAKALRRVLPTARIGICSAGLGYYDTHHPITFGGIQTVAKRWRDFGHIDLIFVDEAHLVPKASAEGQYRRTIANLREINPRLKVIGFTATPYRLDGGLLTSGENRLFTDLIAAKTAGMSIQELIDAGYLSPLTTEAVSTSFNTDGVGKSGGDFIQSKLGEAVNAGDATERACSEMVRLGSSRKSWLVFATNVAHAQRIKYNLDDAGIASQVVTGDTPPRTRDRLIEQYRNGKLRCLVNVGVLTTGFDAPQTDLIAFMRPTESTALYVQMCGRGMRIADGKTDCLVLDFAKNIERHGPVDEVKPKLKRGEKGEPPMRECPQCNDLHHASLRECPGCGLSFEMQPRELQLENRPSREAILAKQRKDRVYTYKPTMVRASVHQKPGKPDSVKVEWFAGLVRVTEWVCPMHMGFAARKARWWWDLHMSGQPPIQTADWVEAINERAILPSELIVKKNGKYLEIIDRKTKVAA